MFDILKIL